MPPIPPRAETAAPRGRLGFLLGGLLLWGLFLGWRLIDLQLLHASEMRSLARKQQEQVMSLDARRGRLYDRNDRELAMSVEVDSLYAVPAEIVDPAATAAALARVLSSDSSAPRVSAAALQPKLTGDKLFVWVRRKIDPGTRTAIEALGLKGIGFAREHKRFYPHGRLASHVLGWVGMDNKGMEGMELQLDERVRGHNGQVFALRDARGKKFLKLTQREPIPGHSVVLTLDQTIQYLAERELARAMEETGARAATAIVMDPSTGDILALANAPDYNPNRPGDAEAESRKNRAVVDAYEPGSTFKVVTMAAALELGLMRPGEIIDCNNGSLRVGGALIRDHKPFGLLSAAKVLHESSNVGAMKIGLRMEGSDFHGAMKRFGFGQRTGVELPGEARGLLRDPKSWSGVSKATLSFGQEISVTPLQLVTAIAAVANDGLLQPPRILLKELDASGGVRLAHDPKPSRRIISKETVRALLPMMTGVVDEGTAKAARLPGYSVAGKTGTAQKIGPEGTYAAGRYVASFVGFAPVTRPALAILVVLDEPRGSMYHGGDIAAPVFARIALPALRYLGVPPEEDRLFEADGGQGAPLAAAAHARRWIEPMPLNEKEWREERERKAREELKAAIQRNRREKERRAREQRQEAVEAPAGPLPVQPARRPLPEPPVASARTDGAPGMNDIVLPDLVGQPLRRAVSWLARAGMSARIDSPASAPDGLVVAQDPAAGTAVARGSLVVVGTGFMVEPAEETLEESEELTAKAEAAEPAAAAKAAKAPGHQPRPSRRSRR